MSDIETSQRVDLGSGHSYKLMRYEDVFEGLLLTFADGAACSICFHGNTRWARERTVNLWAVVQREPLTLSPSIVHKGHHGHIVQGRWVPV